ILQAIGDRLQQNTMTLYATVEDTLLSAANNIQPRADFETALATICNHFGNDIDRRKLCLNLEMLHDLMNGKVACKISDITEALNALGPARQLYSELSALVGLLLVIPVSSATAERSFSCLRRLKTYLRST